MNETQPKTIPWRRLRVVCGGREVKSESRRLKMLEAFYDDRPLPCGCQVELPKESWTINWMGFRGEA